MQVFGYSCELVKILVNDTKHHQRIQILTLAPNGWTIEQTAKEFDVSIRMVKREFKNGSKKLKMKEGILSTSSTSTT